MERTQKRNELNLNPRPCNAIAIASSTTSKHGIYTAAARACGVLTPTDEASCADTRRERMMVGRGGAGFQREVRSGIRDDT